MHGCMGAERVKRCRAKKAKSRVVTVGTVTTCRHLPTRATSTPLPLATSAHLNSHHHTTCSLHLPLPPLPQPRSPPAAHGTPAHHERLAHPEPPGRAVVALRLHLPRQAGHPARVPGAVRGAHSGARVQSVWVRYLCRYCAHGLRRLCQAFLDIPGAVCGADTGACNGMRWVLYWDPQVGARSRGCCCRAPLPCRP